MTKGISSKRVLAVCSVLVSATLLWAGDKVWSGKPYQSWDAKDVREIMTHSPWVATTSIRRSWTSPRSSTVVQPVEPQISGGVRSGPSVVGTVASSTGGTAPAQQLNVYIYWFSSRVIRAASAREAVLHGSMEQATIEKFVNAPQAEYQIVLRMDDMAPFSAKGESFYQQNAFLQMRRSKRKLPPSKVVYERMGTTSEDVVFFFPKTANGAPTISSDETDVTFSCKIADQTLRADFKPKKMVDQFGADL